MIKRTKTYNTIMFKLINCKRLLLPSLAIGLLMLAALYYSGFLFYIGISPCILPPPPQIMVDGMALARVYTWYDSNENGLVDSGETALPNVTIAYPFSSPTQLTDPKGYAETGQLKPGCTCKCWQQEYVEVVAPEGYRATTPLRQNLTGDHLVYQFGFVKINP